MRTLSMIKDAFGRVAKVGDVIAYANGGYGAKSFNVATIIRLSPKSVVFEDGTFEVDFHGKEIPNERYRVEGSFVIKVETENE